MSGCGSPPGRRVAVVGPSGAGKTTLALVLVRFLDYQAGSVTLGGVELDRLAGDDVRRMVGLVDQDLHLFDTTIAENLRLGKRNADPDELLEVLDRVGLGGWVRELPLGLSTMVGGMGSRLSGGQRQRLAVARALLADFPVLVLDEPAEHLDESAADALTQDILWAGGDRSILLITHRLTGLEFFDEILVLEDGVVAQRGTHDELAATSGHVRRPLARSDIIFCPTRQPAQREWRHMSERQRANHRHFRAQRPTWERQPEGRVGS